MSADNPTVEADRIWGEGNWIICEDCPNVVADTAVRHHKDFHGTTPAPLNPDTDGPLEPCGRSLCPTCYPTPTAEARAEHQFGPGFKCSFCDRDSSHAVWGHPVCDWSDCEDAAQDAGPLAATPAPVTPPTADDNGGCPPHCSPYECAITPSRHCCLEPDNALDDNLPAQPTVTDTDTVAVPRAVLVDLATALNRDLTPAFVNLCARKVLRAAGVSGE